MAAKKIGLSSSKGDFIYGGVGLVRYSMFLEGGGYNAERCHNFVSTVSSDFVSQLWP